MSNSANKSLSIICLLMSLIILILLPKIVRAEEDTENESNCCCCCTCACQTETEPENTDGIGGEETTVPTADIHLVINEIFPDPVGTDTENEFIELKNVGQVDANLNGWIIQVGTKQFQFTGDSTLPASGIRYWMYSETKLTLTNSGNTASLIEPDGTTVHDSVTYPGPAKTGQTYARHESGSWSWTEEPTPGTNNSFVTTIVPEPDDTPNDTVSDTVNDVIETPNDTTAESDGVGGQTNEIDLVINELLPDPDGSDSAEWIELWNIGQDAAKLDGWLLDDADGGSRPFSLSGQQVEAGGFLLIAKSISGLALNNDGDDVRLIDPTGQVADSVTYKEAPTGQSFARFGEDWLWVSQPTPGQANMPEIAMETYGDNIHPDEITADGVDDDFEETPVIVPLSELPDMENGTLVTVEATVSLPLDIVGKTIFMIEDTYGGTGAEARLYGKERPEFRPGQWVRLQGRVSQSETGWRLNVLKDGLTVMETSKPVEPAVIAPELLDREHNGMTISLTGLVTAKNGRRLKLTDEAGESRIDVHLLGDDDVPGSIGDLMEAIGVVRWKSDEAEIIVLGQNDLTIRQAAPEEDVQPKESLIPNLGLTLPQNSGNSGVPGWPMAIAGASLAGMVTMAWLNWRRHQAQS